MVLRLSNFSDELDFDAGAEGYLGNAEDSAGARAKRIKQWTFYKRDETSIRKVKQMIRAARLDRKYFRTKSVLTPRAGSTADNETSELSTGNLGENKLRK